MLALSSHFSSCCLNAVLGQFYLEKCLLAIACLTPETVTVECRSVTLPISSVAASPAMTIYAERSFNKLVPTLTFFYHAAEVMLSTIERSGVCCGMLALVTDRERLNKSPMGIFVCIFLKELWVETRDVLLINRREEVKGGGRRKSDCRQST